jgi:predicted dehydrogenase
MTASTALFFGAYRPRPKARMTVTGTRGSVTLDPAYEYVQALESHLRIGERRFGKRDQFAAELEYFSQCILDDRTPEPSGAEGLADVMIIEAMHRSINIGRWIAVMTPGHRRSEPIIGREHRSYLRVH